MINNETYYNQMLHINSFNIKNMPVWDGKFKFYLPVSFSEMI